MKDWAQLGECRTDNVDYRANFFPDRSNSQGIDEAKTVCRKCPVRVFCLQEALEIPLGNGAWVQGIFGATTEWEREKIRAMLAGRSFAQARQDFLGQTS
ncbi:MAG: WhiB family transcriptional regulator [Nitrososphaeraceae archaeon]